MGALAGQLGEATHREDLVQQSLYRLELIDPNNPDVVAARFRSLLRQGDIDGAQKQLDRLSQLAPSSNAYKSSRTTMLLSTPDGRQALQQARLQATTGHAEEAVASYNKLFNGAPPEGDIAVEYWSTVAKIPARRGEAINQLKRINADAPGNTGLQNNLALLLFSSDRRDEGFAVLEQMAKSNAGREGASKIWYGQIKDMPVSDASVSALKKYLSIFSDGDSVAAAQSQLAEQQKQLADPAFRARAQGLAAVDSGMAGKAIPELQQAVRANPKDSEALGALGQAYSQKGDRANAVANLEKALALDPHSSNNDKWNSLLKVNRYWLAIQQGDAALKANNPDRAERLFQQARNVDNTDSYAVLGLGDVAMARKDYPAAERYYQQTLRMDSGNTNAVRGLANIYRQQSPEKAEAFIASLSASQRRSIDDIERSLQNDRLAQQAEALENQGKWAQAAALQRRVALAQAQLGDTAAAQRTFNKLIPQAKSQPPSMESAMVLRDGAKFEAQAGDPTQALETYKDAMVASGVTTTRPQDNDTFTRLTRNDEKDDWLKRGVRSDAADLYRQQDLNVTLEHDYWGSSGTGGYSDLKAHTTMLQVDAPYSDGRMFFRSDFVNMNVGSFSTNADGKWDDNWGTCTLQDCSGNRSQSDSGASVAVGWRNDVWSWDIGTTPMGFNVVDVVGGISYSDDIGPLGYTVNAHRRPISSSLLAFGGQKDSPSNTGKKWGGVRADGVGLSLSYDKGEANGVWASLSGDQLTGKNVEDNWRVRWMTGYYYKVINQNNRRVTIGLNNMIWHYDKDLSGYSLGQGGYYSPQEYLSFAIPVMWRERTENWSWELGASGSWSHSRTKTMPRYPLMNLIPTDWQEEAARQSNDGGSSQGFGYTARALLERRVTSNWFVGTAIDIQQAKDYAPSHFLLYVRYSAAGWQGDMDLPPQPLIPYADW
ncbi:cellulose synthase complex outer membrane protein BcsC [Escherichia coli]|uniref:cellulose synthase complex outer membrane protein BcsC n=1 Tax=Escherichia coli TaxID=562 RepID=UPI001CDABB49|nr:cellulose synthase complex outer membrane protein BcsC [Escherichia coli]